MPKPARNALRGSEEFFRTIFENIHVSIGIFDVQAGEPENISQIVRLTRFWATAKKN